MPADAAANGPVWSVSTPRVMESLVTPGPTWSLAFASATDPVAQTPSPARPAISAPAMSFLVRLAMGTLLLV